VRLLAIIAAENHISSERAIVIKLKGYTDNENHVMKII
jgi:hypothetical protein